MKVILNEDVYNLGEEGDVKDVAPGYARNFLIPKGMVVAYTKQSMGQFEQRRKAIEERKEEKRTAAMTLKDRIEALTLTLEMPAGQTGKLFGSVTNAALAERLEQEGIAIERKKIDIPGHSLKAVGTYTVLVKLYADQSANLSVEIVQTEASKSPEQKRQEAASAKAASDAKKAAEAEPADADQADTEASSADEPAQDAPEEPAEDAAEADVADEKDKEE